MDDQLVLKNRLKVARAEKNLSQGDLAKLVGVSRQTISSIETGQFNHWCCASRWTKNLKICFIFSCKKRPPVGPLFL